jgi:1,4-alpha-glucan branching enzyme
MDMKKVTFLIYAPSARDVHLAGDFNNWDAGSIPLTRMQDEKRGFWSVDIQLPPGGYQYNFFIDGEWIYKVPGGVVVEKTWVQDILAAELVLGSNGTQNCLITIV